MKPELKTAMIVAGTAPDLKGKILNKTTQETFKKTDEGKELVKCKDADDMFKRLGI